MLNKESVGLIAHFLKAYPKRSALIVGLLIVSGFMEGIGIVALLPVLEIAVVEPGAPDTRVLAYARTALGYVGLQPTLGVLLSIIVGGMALKGTFQWLAVRQVGYTVANVATDLRLTLIRAMLHAGWGYFLGQRAGHLSNAIGTEAQRASAAYQAVCTLFATAIQVLVYLILSILISPAVALAAVLAGLFIALIFAGMVRMARDAGRRQTALVKSLSARLIDALQALKPIKAMAQEKHLRPLLEAETRELNEAQRRQVLAAGTMTAFKEPLLVCILALGLYFVLTSTTVAFASLLVMALLFHKLVGRINALQAEYQLIVKAESAFWSLRGSVEQAEAQREEVGAGKPALLLAEGIEFRDVWFSYGDRPVLRGVSFEVPAGSFAAIVGPSGAGKTTIVDLIIGLFRQQEGEILVDGIPVDGLKLSGWRQQIGYVPQEMLLFHDTVYQNVTLGDMSISREAVEDALRRAGAWDFVAQLPLGIDNVMGERGAKLSGGQRQRVSIARALVRNPRLLILDEVTTSLDPATEAEICETLRQLRGEVTVIAISHQKAITNVADQVFRLESGVIEPVIPPTTVARVANA